MTLTLVLKIEEEEQQRRRRAAAGETAAAIEVVVRWSHDWRPIGATRLLTGAAELFLQTPPQNPKKQSNQESKLQTIDFFSPHISQNSLSLYMTVLTLQPALLPNSHFKFKLLPLSLFFPKREYKLNNSSLLLLSLHSLLKEKKEMGGPKKPCLSNSQTSNSSSSSSSYISLYLNPLTDLSPTSTPNKENVAPDPTGCSSFKKKVVFKNQPQPLQQPLEENNSNNNRPLKASSLQLCIKLNEPDSADVWDFSDSEAAPASSWSALPNRSLLCRPLPLDVGKCTCIIVKESTQGMNGKSMSIYSLCTNEGHGRQDRKLAVARHRRQNGRSKFLVAQNPKGLLCSSDESFLGTITANLMGSKFQIWDQGRGRDFLRSQSKRLLGVVGFVPTITTLTGNFRTMKAWIPKQQSMQLKNTNATQINHINGLANGWEEKGNKAHQLFSREPYYNYSTKRYELDFRERAGRSVPKIKTSTKNFQLTMEEKGKQTILQLGKIGKSKYVMDYRYPLTGYQAFCICLASIDSKACCLV